MALVHEDAILHLKSFPQSMDVDHWTKRNDVELPQDLLSFYKQCNGLDACWSFGAENKVAGRLLIRPIQDLRVARLHFKNSRVPFALLAKDSFGAVFMSLSGVYDRGSVWFYPGSYTVTVDVSVSDLYMLCESFSSYYRLMTIHYGILGWQCAFVPHLGLPVVSKLLMARLCPDRLAIDVALTHQLEYDPTGSLTSEYGPARFGAGLLAHI